MFISFVFAEIFLRLFICLLCEVPWNAHNAPSSRVSLYLESEKQSSLDSSITLRFSDLNGPSTCQRSLSCLTSGLLNAHVCFKACKLEYLGWGGVFISTSVNRRERWPIPMSCRNIGQIASGPAQPPLERRVKRKSGHLTPVTVGSSQHCFDEEFTESFDAVIPGMHSSNSDSWSGVFTATFHIQLNIYFYRWKHFNHNLCLLFLSH